MIPTRSMEELAFPSRIKEEEFTAWLARSGRAGASPTTASRMWEHVLSVPDDLTPPGITTPTLVLHNRDCMQPEAECRAVADAIPGATFVQVAGVDSYPIAGNVDLLTAEIAEFVTGGPSGLTPLRHVSAVMFTDLVDSTQRAVDEGDAQWRDLLDIHDRTVQGCVRHHGGRVVKYTGDGVLALDAVGDGRARGGAGPPGRAARARPARAGGRPRRRRRRARRRRVGARGQHRREDHEPRRNRRDARVRSRPAGDAGLTPSLRR